MAACRNSLENTGKMGLPLKDQGGQNGFLRFWAAYCEFILFWEFLKLFVEDMDGSFPCTI
jgi:hypothetical protein